jgi:PAS domain S-box-containing protein
VIVALASPYLKVWISWGEGVSEDWQRAVTQAVSIPELRSFFSPRDSTIWPELTRQGKSAFALLFSPGNTRYNDSYSFEILEELKRLSGARLPIFGGSSADDWCMEGNYVFVGQRVYRDAVVVAVFETTLRFGIGLAHGLQPSSRRATVTRAHGHELLELDGKPAADAYAEMLGTTRVALEGWHLTLSTGQPAGILDPYGQYSINAASYFTPQGTVRFAQPVLEGTVLTIMEANQDSMITAGQEALRKATLRGQITQPVVALVCSCALRTRLLRERTQEELVGMKRIMPDIPLVGFYGFGEQGVADDGVNRHTDEAITVLVLGQELSFGAQLQQSEEKYRALIETTDTGYLIIDSEGRVLDANPEYMRLTGHTILQEILGRKVTEWTAEHDLARNANKIRECLSRGFVRNLEIDYINKREQLTPIEINATVLRTADSLKIVALCRDITERKQNEQKIRRLNRILFTLSQLNQAVFHAQSREELFESVCQVVVKHGEIKFAWIGWHNPQTQAIDPVAYAGNGSDYLKRITIYADERPEELGPTGTAFREGKGVVCNDFAHDPCTKPWQEAAVRL